MTTSYPPDPNVGYYAPQRPRRPTILTVAAIIGIVWSALVLLCTPISLIPMFVDLGQPNPAIDALKENRAVFGWTIVSTILSFALGILLLASSIGALMLKRWSRRGMIIYGAASIVLAIAGAVVNFTWVLPKMQQVQQDQAAAIGGMIGTVVGMLIGLALPVFMLIAFTRPQVKQALEGDTAATMYPPPPQSTPPPW